MKQKLLDIVIDKFNLDSKVAQALIMAGKVLVNEEKITKSGVKIDIDKNIRIKSDRRYVSRGAYKLEEALKVFDVDVNNKICVDVGSSTGGFTEVLLLNGASRVYAVDSGTNQLAYMLRVDDRVKSIENKKIQEVFCDDLESQPEIAVSDVSFTTILPIIKHLNQKLKIQKMIILVKPQFEYEQLINELNLSGDFSGIVKFDEEREKILEYVLNGISRVGLTVVNCIESPIKGTKGNIEYLVYIKEN